MKVIRFFFDVFEGFFLFLFFLALGNFMFVFFFVIFSFVVWGGLVSSSSFEYFIVSDVGGKR